MTEPLHAAPSPERRPWRTLLIAFVLLGGVGTVLMVGGALLGFRGPATVQAWIGAGARGPWALPVAIGAFAGLAFLGAPQFVLVAAAVVAFGPWRGFTYSWIGNLVSALLGFYVGRALGARALERYAGGGLRDFMELVGRNGFWASLLVRLVPAAPFIVVNMAAGVTSMGVAEFLAGTAIGGTPKIALVAFAGSAALKGGAVRWATVGLAVVVWLAIGLMAREWVKRRKQAPGGAVSAEAPL
jgi:uncharacterized membrane protein YdjX (TVP38/TMEM64 family)